MMARAVRLRPQYMASRRYMICEFIFTLLRYDCERITLLEEQGLLLDSSLTINHNKPDTTGRVAADAPPA